MTSPIRIGLLGSSWIAGPAILEPARGEPRVVVTRVASRDSQRAADYARSNGIPGIAVDYAALVTDTEVDLVYVALPPSEHCRWTVAALEAGKHVVCEKPFAMNAEEARRMVAAASANGRHLIEAWHYRFHPLMHRVEKILHSGILGQLLRASARFDVPTPESENQFRWNSQLGGGALMDAGGYTIHVLRTLIGREPSIGNACSNHAGGIDLKTSAQLDFGQGVEAHIECAMGCDSLFSELYLEGTAGSLTVNGFPLPQWGCSLTLETVAGTSTECDFPGTTYQAQFEHIISVLSGKALPLTGGFDAIANMQVIDSIRRQASQSVK
jgi:predicted dehydrogenase